MSGYASKPNPADTCVGEIFTGGGQDWVVVEVEKIPEAYWAEHGRAWGMPSGDLPWNESPPGHAEEWAGKDGGVLKGETKYYKWALIPARFVVPTPDPWPDPTYGETSL